jgi:hemoglobin
VRKSARIAPAALSFGLFLAGCAGRSPQSEEGAGGAGAKGVDPKSLYARLGGERTIAALVDDFVPRAALDPKVNFVREGTAREWQPTPENVAHLKKMLVEFLCAAAGGPLKYEGKELKSVHAGMKITASEIDAFAADFKATLEKLKVPPREQVEFLALINAAGSDLVE